MFDTPESRWRALQTRNRLAASAFLYGVTTTRIYCRPACPSRLARQANIVFFDSATEAESAGFRPCRRCKPSKSDFEPKTVQHEKAVRKACNLIDAAGGRLTLDNLASSVGLSPRYFHGIFKNAMGVTPSVYAMRVRKGKTVRTSQSGGKPEDACTVNRALSSGTGYGRNGGETRESVLSENMFRSTLMEMPPNQIPADPGVHALGCTSFECLFSKDIDGCFPGSELLTSQDFLEDDPDSLDDNGLMLYLFEHGVPHDTGITTDHGIPYSPQLPGTLSSRCDLASKYS